MFCVQLLQWLCCRNILIVVCSSAWKHNTSSLYLFDKLFTISFISACLLSLSLCFCFIHLLALHVPSCRNHLFPSLHLAWGVTEANVYWWRPSVCLCVSICLSVPRRIPILLHGSGCNFGNGSGCPLVVHYRADLQSVHGFRCYDNIALNAKCQRVLVLTLCLVK